MDNKIFLGNIGKLRFTLYVKERQIGVGDEIIERFRYSFSELLFTRISGGIKREIQRKIEIKEEEFEDTLKKEFLIFDDSSLTIRYSSQKKFFLLGSVSQVVESIEDVARLLYSHILTKAIYLSSQPNEINILETENLHIRYNLNRSTYVRREMEGDVYVNIALVIDMIKSLLLIFEHLAILYLRI